MDEQCQPPSLDNIDGFHIVSSHKKLDYPVKFDSVADGAIWVYWGGDDCYYEGTIMCQKKKLHKVKYADGEVHMEDLSTTPFVVFGFAEVASYKIVHVRLAGVMKKKKKNLELRKLTNPMWMEAMQGSCRFKKRAKPRHYCEISCSDDFEDSSWSS